MRKIYKILAMLLVVAAVVFAAGCSSKNNANSTQPSVAAENITESTSAANVSPSTEVTEAPTENMTATPTENITANASVPTVPANGTHLNSVQRHALVAQQQAQQQQSNSTSAVTPNNY